MKSKKTKKSYATGGAMDSLLPLLSSLGGGAGAVNPALGLIGAVPGLIQGYMNQQRQNATVVSATPGNYVTGGPIGQSTMKYQVSDNRVMGSPDNMNYQGGIEMLGLGLGFTGLAELATGSVGTSPVILRAMYGKNLTSTPFGLGTSQPIPANRMKNYADGGPIDTAKTKSYDREKLKAVQLDLKYKGLYNGKIDGIYGPQLEKAIQHYNRTGQGIQGKEVIISPKKKLSLVEE